jgi:hypothetical protein
LQIAALFDLFPLFVSFISFTNIHQVIYQKTTSHKLKTSNWLHYTTYSPRNSSQVHQKREYSRIWSYQKEKEEEQGNSTSNQEENLCIAYRWSV